MNTQVELSAALTGIDTLNITAKKGFWADRSSTFRLYEDGKEVAKLHAMSRAEVGNNYVFTILINYKFTLGKLYEISDCKNTFAPVDLSYLAHTDEFDKAFRCDKPQGAIYSKKETTFRLYSPLAQRVELYVLKPGADTYTGYLMTREECGCYSVTVKGDLERSKYFYTASIDGKFYTACDPFGFSTDTNSRHSYVIDPEKVLSESDGSDSLKPLGGAENSIIYECHVRDMTSKLDIPDKGTFAALSRHGLTWGPEKFPAGLDYLSRLGVTHIQLQPVMDYQTVDEAHPTESYNWGYDPVNYFVPEGSLSTDPEDPYCRLRELRGLARALHESGLRVVYDVVYNHVFERSTNPLEILCPGYYFRYCSDGKPSDGSFCGNDLESRHYMCRRLIIESLEHMQRWFGADGFRFDLMGIIDRETIAQAYERLSKNDPDILLYGEGWDMPTCLPSDLKTTQSNAKTLPQIGFFSDFYRDISKGGTPKDKLGERGYLTGDISRREDFKFAYAACCLNLSREPTFARPTQCISYVECHDNSTLWDKLKVCCAGESDELLMRRIKMINAVIVLSAGIPFFHAGQEFGESKGGDDNSFCAGDQVNGLDYALAYQRRDTVEFFRSICRFRRTHPEFCFSTREEMMQRLSFKSFGDGCLMVSYDSGQSGVYHVMINVSNRSGQYAFPNYVKVVLTDSGIISQQYDFYSQLVLVNGLSLIVCYQRADGASEA